MVAAAERDVAQALDAVGLAEYGADFLEEGQGAFISGARGVMVAAAERDVAQALDAPRFRSKVSRAVRHPDCRSQQGRSAQAGESPERRHPPARVHRRFALRLRQPDRPFNIRRLRRQQGRNLSACCRAGFLSAAAESQKVPHQPGLFAGHGPVGQVRAQRGQHAQAVVFQECQGIALQVGGRLLHRPAALSWQGKQGRQIPLMRARRQAGQPAQQKLRSTVQPRIAHCQLIGDEQTAVPVPGPWLAQKAGLLGVPAPPHVRRFAVPRLRSQQSDGMRNALHLTHQLLPHRLQAFSLRHTRFVPEQKPRIALAQARRLVSVKIQVARSLMPLHPHHQPNVLHSRQPRQPVFTWRGVLSPGRLEVVDRHRGWPAPQTVQHAGFVIPFRLAEPLEIHARHQCFSAEELVASQMESPPAKLRQHGRLLQQLQDRRAFSDSRRPPDQQGLAAVLQPRAANPAHELVAPYHQSGIQRRWRVEWRIGALRARSPSAKLLQNLVALGLHLVQNLFFAGGIPQQCESGLCPGLSLEFFGKVQPEVVHPPVLKCSPDVFRRFPASGFQCLQSVAGKLCRVRFVVDHAQSRRVQVRAGTRLLQFFQAPLAMVQRAAQPRFGAARVESAGYIGEPTNAKPSKPPAAVSIRRRRVALPQGEQVGPYSASRQGVFQVMIVRRIQPGPPLVEFLLQSIEVLLREPFHQNRGKLGHQQRRQPQRCRFAATAHVVAGDLRPNRGQSNQQCGGLTHSGFWILTGNTTGLLRTAINSSSPNRVSNVSAVVPGTTRKGSRSSG